MTLHAANCVPNRVEDARVVRGTTRHLDDITLPGMLHASFVRSPFPHARILSVDMSAAKRAPGVVLTLTAGELMNVVLAFEPTAPPGFFCPSYGPFATDVVRFVGDPVAVIVAETRAQAEDAAELVDIDYDELPAVSRIDVAQDPLSQPIWEDHGSNVLWEEIRDFGDVTTAFDSAPHSARRRFESTRQTHLPMETSGCIASYDPRTQELQCWLPTQSPNAFRHGLSRQLQIPADRIRVVVPDVGGSFGQKGQFAQEHVVVAAASTLVERPVKWIQDRYENLLVGGQAREEVVDVEVAFDEGGVVHGLRVEMTLDQGAYPTAWPRSVTLSQVRTLFPSAYRFGAMSFTGRVVASNKASYLPYRGPWAAETWVRERVLDIVAAEVGIDPFEIRRRNLVDGSTPGVTMLTGASLEGVSLREALDVAEERIRGTAPRNEPRSKAIGDVRRGVGVACFIEPAPGPPSYATALTGVEGRRGSQASARLERDGSVTVHITQSPTGQSHATTFAQEFAAVLGIEPTLVAIRYGDTAEGPFEMFGTGGSSAAHMTSGAVRDAATRLLGKVLLVGSHLLGAAPDDLQVIDGGVSVRGKPQVKASLAEIAQAGRDNPEVLAANDESNGLEVVGRYENSDCGWSESVHACVVDVDLGTGLVEIVRYVVVENCGRVINPRIVDGQISGGVAQGIGSVLLEESTFDDYGNPTATTLLDYLVPTSLDVPPVEIIHWPAAADAAPRGCGEGGTIGATAAVGNAVAAALRPLGADVLCRYLPPSRLLEVAGVIESRL